ncbi:MAG: hypothetical protein AB1505_28920 [Candidatus Latescibacterota bacterium]
MQPRPRGAGPRDGAARLLLVFLLLAARPAAAAPPAPDWAAPQTLGRSSRYPSSHHRVVLQPGCGLVDTVHAARRSSSHSPGSPPCS